MAPKNLQAVIDWCKEHRPDLVSVVEAERNNTGFILLMTVGFESGRHFQAKNPDFPLDQPHLYLVDDPLAKWLSGPESI